MKRGALLTQDKFEARELGTTVDLKPLASVEEIYELVSSLNQIAAEVGSDEANLEAKLLVSHHILSRESWFGADVLDQVRVYLMEIVLKDFRHPQMNSNVPHRELFL